MLRSTAVVSEVMGLRRGKPRVLALSLLALVVGLSVLAVDARPTHADTTFTVNSTADLADANLSDANCDVNPNISGNTCTLRAAIEEANNTPGADTINFNIITIGGSAVKTISPTSELPNITTTMTIDGYTQPGASPNTLKKGNDAVLLIELDGTNAGTGEEADGLNIVNTSNVVVRGLVINRFDSSGIGVTGDPAITTGNRIEGNFIGTDPSGTQDLGNGANGVVDNGNANTLGGTSPEARNLISGNGSSGLLLGPSADGAKISGNYIGTNKDGTGALGNGNDGVTFSGASGNTVGGTTAGAANTIAFNGGGGVEVQKGPGPNFTVPSANHILRNSIFSNQGLGIDLNNDGPTANDGGTADDSDTGPNGLQNKPNLRSATTSGTTATIRGALDTKSTETFTVQFFSQPSGNEGKKFIGQKQVTTDSDGRVTFSFTPSNRVAVGQKITATATGPEGTSEFSAPREVTAS